MKSKLYLKEQVDNKDFTFGEVKKYFPIIVIDSKGFKRHGLLTKNMIKQIIERADKNEEDMPDKTFWDNMKEDPEFSITNI